MTALEILTKGSSRDRSSANNQKIKLEYSAMSERITEDIVREHFKNDILFESIKFEEQSSKNERIKKLLGSASKRGTGKAGFPEYVITFPAFMNLAIIVECKSESKFHASKTSKEYNPEKYAVDGALHYSKFLKTEFDIIAIAASGQNKNNLSVSNFIIKKGGKEKKLPDTKLLSIYDYMSLIESENNAEKLKHENILLTASRLNDKLYSYSVPEGERASIVSGILIALQDNVFREGYRLYTEPSELVGGVLQAIERILKKNKMGDKILTLMDEYTKIKSSTQLAKEQKIRDPKTSNDEDNTILRELIYEVETKVFPFTNYKKKGYDILGQFYSEFIRYTNGDKKLGLVLTPQHVAELFVEIANLNKNDILYDNCCGTAVFLIKGMEKLIQLAGNDEAKKANIKTNQIFGFETRSDMFTYACSNMMMRGDGKSNIIQGDSLSTEKKELVKKYNPTVGLLNPPYSTGVSELEFVYHNLDCLKVDGRCIAIIPFSSVLVESNKNNDWKKKLLQEHTLEAVFSMPIDLFSPTGAVTVVVVFKAHNPHPDNYETYFGFWTDDGFDKKQKVGRIDRYDRWDGIKKNWLYNFRNKKRVSGQSVMTVVTADDEWCAEAYLETDYSDLTSSSFEDEIKKFLSYKIRNV